MSNKIKKILNSQINKIKPEKGEILKINEETEKFIAKLKEGIKAKKIDAEVFVGGSLAKGTLIKKSKYDIDIFVRFNKKYKDNKISEMLGKIIQGKRVHGSRDYFQVDKRTFIFEIVPSVKIRNPEDARNITDLSYFHVSYVKSRINKKNGLADEIMLAKAFCHANGCYGAESYINGFSGYALELLVIYYGSFITFLKETKDKDKIILDPEKFYKNKNSVMLELNESKLQSPIIFVDPTFKQRNALAALSKETFEKFQKAAGEFLKKPSDSFFIKKVLEEKIKIKHKESIIILAFTNKPKGDIGGSKLKKFHNYLSDKLEKDFIIKAREFEYLEDKNIAKNYFALKQKKEIIISGPPITKQDNLAEFKKKHKNCFIKKGRVYAKENSKNIEEFLEKLKLDKSLKEMNIENIKLI